jgi:hypothetical protein
VFGISVRAQLLDEAIYGIYLNLYDAHRWLYHVKVCHRVELVLGHSIKLLAVFGSEEDKGREQVLIDFKDLFDTSVHKDRTHQSLEDISKHLGRLEQLHFTTVHVEVSLERILNILVSILLIHMLLHFLGNLPLVENATTLRRFLRRQLPNLLTCFGLLLVIEYEPMETKQTDKLR